MARRKRGYLDEGCSSDSASSSASIPNKKGKEEEIYGIFGDEGENEQRGGIGRTVRGEDQKGRKIDYLRGQAFVSATNNVEPQAENDDNMDLSVSDSDQSEDESSSSEMEEFARQAAEEEEEMEHRNAFQTVPTMEGQEIENRGEFEPTSFISSRGGIGSSRLGIGAQQREPDPVDEDDQPAPNAGIGSRTGIGSSRGIPSESSGREVPRMSSLNQFMPANEPSTSVLQQNVPPSSAFSQRASQTSNTSSVFTGPTPKISFKTGGGKFDPAKYLAQMGWSGGGLGKQGEGIVIPIEVKQRPERAGIAFGGIKEKTKQAKEEARRRGEKVSSDEEQEKKNKTRAQKSSSKIEKQAWTKPERKPRKPKIEHRTYEQILAEHGHNGIPNENNQIIVDATGKEYSSLSAALAKHAVPTNDSTQLIEIRHNLRLICDGNLKALDVLANEGSAIQDRRKWLERGLHEAVRRKQDLVTKHKRVETVAEIVKEIELLGKRAAIDPSIGLESFIQPVQKILQHHKDAIAEMELDAALVGAIVPIFKRELSQWSLLQDPTRLCIPLRSISGALRISIKEDVMTPYQSLLWNVWMPPVRSALNNEWNVFDSTTATKFFETWKPLLPAFIRDNITHQLILPKLRSAVSDWDGKSALYKVVFPWMPLLHHQMDDIISEAKRRIRSSLKSWRVSKGVPSELRKWRDVFRRSEWDSMLLEYVVEKLSTYLKVELKITSDPKAQDRQPLKDILQWKSSLGSKMMSKVLLNGFIPNWLGQMHAMLIHPNSNMVDVADWYSKWKSYLEKKEVDKLESVQIGFQAALRMMDDALRFDRTLLKMPDLKQMQRKSEAESIQKKSSKVKSTRGEASTASFRQIIEEAAAEVDLIVQALNKTETRSGMPLYRISRLIDGKSGLTFYLEDDVIFLERKMERGQFDPISVEELIKSCV
ncbi:hypothetical protein L7F22_019059 [Adiantum nelumboides]|nr:hypothetical protein [Adiantum nelumboides]